MVTGMVTWYRALCITSTACALAAIHAQPTQPLYSLTALPELQDIPFNHVTFLGTHNPVSTKALPLDVRNQQQPLAQQLADGVRVFSFRVHDDLSHGQMRATVCHGNMAVRLPKNLDQGYACVVDGGAMSLKNFLEIIGSFLTAYPTEIITLHIGDFTNESHPRSQPSLIVQAFQEAGAQPLVYHVTSFDQPWPTIRQLQERNTRLIVMHSHNNQDSPFAGWLLPQWLYVIDTPSGQNTEAAIVQDYRSFKIPTGPTAPPAYTTKSRALFKVNHHATVGIAGSKKIAKRINTYPVAMARMKAWQDLIGVPPHALTVDFYDIPDAQELFKAVKDLTLHNAKLYKQGLEPQA